MHLPLFDTSICFINLIYTDQRIAAEVEQLDLGPRTEGNPRAAENWRFYTRLRSRTQVR